MIITKVTNLEKMFLLEKKTVISYSLSRNSMIAGPHSFATNHHDFMSPIFPPGVRYKIPSFPYNID